MQGTRVLLLANLWEWAEDQKVSPVFWLNGIAGAGKTTVLETFCRMLDSKGLLGGSFFCSRKTKERANLRNMFPSLAHALARTYPAYRDALVNVLQFKECSDPLGMNLGDQYTKLILGPAKTAFEQRTSAIVLAIDALDECEDSTSIERILRVIMTATPTRYLKILISSRPEAPIRRVFDSGNHKYLRLQDIEDHIVEADITMYFTHQLQEIVALRKAYADNEWPPSEITVLCKRAGKLFIYAYTAFIYISHYKGNPLERLKKLASLTKTPPVALANIDSIYSFVLSEAFTDLDSEEKALLVNCLRLLVCARQPLPVAAYAELLNTTPQLVRTAFESLHSVVSLPNRDDGPENITIYHMSFPDYLTAIERAGHNEWFIGLQLSHLEISNRCFAIMESQLHFGIGGLGSSHDMDLQHSPNIPKHLSYVCAMWGDHILQSSNSDVQLPHSWLSALESFLLSRFLYWLEIISILKQIPFARHLLITLSNVSSLISTTVFEC